MTFTERYQKKLARYRKQNAAARREEQAMPEPEIVPRGGPNPMDRWLRDPEFQREYKAALEAERKKHFEF